MDAKIIQFDLGHLRNVTGDDREFMIEIMEMIVDESPDVVREIKGYLARGEFEPLAKAAHKYKSSINILGNADMIRLMKDMELKTLESRDTGIVSPMVEEFETLVEGLIEWINSQVSELRAVA